MRIFGFEGKRLKTREFQWQRHYGGHLVSFVMNISGAKFEEHCFDIFRDICIQYFIILVANLMTLSLS